MSFTGYRLYRGAGSLGSVDFTAPVATAAAGDTAVVVAGAGHDPGRTYTYVLRPVRGGLESPDVSCVAEVTFDQAGEWTGARPNAVDALRAESVSGGRIRVRWRWTRRYGAADAAQFDLYTSVSARVDRTGAPVLTLPANDQSDYETVLTWADGASRYIVVAARAATGAASRSVVIGPVTADATTPPTPRAVAVGGF